MALVSHQPIGLPLQLSPDLLPGIRDLKKPRAYFFNRFSGRLSRDHLGFDRIHGPRGLHTGAAAFPKRCKRSMEKADTAGIEDFIVPVKLPQAAAAILGADKIHYL